MSNVRLGSPYSSLSMKYPKEHLVSRDINRVSKYLLDNMAIYLFVYEDFYHSFCVPVLGTIRN